MSKNILNCLEDVFSLDEKNITKYSALQLAYLGDAFYEILIRTLVAKTTEGAVKNFHSKGASFVNAKAQATLISYILDELDEKETAAFKHGRNAKTSSVAKNADIKDYRNATGLESLFGYLYLTHNSERAIELLNHAITKSEGEFTL